MINQRATGLYYSILLALCLLVAPSTQAATTDTWSGATNSGWVTPGNWNTAPATGSILAFTSATGNGGLNLNDNLAVGFSLGGITFSSTAAAFVITGNSFALTGGITDSAANAESIGDAITMSSVQTFSTASTLTLGGNISGNGGITTAGAGTLILGGTNSYTGKTTVGTGTLTLNSSGVLGSGGGTAITVSGGTLNDNSTVATTGGITGTSSLTINSGTATLNTANNYSGGTTLNGGTLNINNASALGSGSLNISGGTIDATNGAITVGTSPAVTISDDFTFGGSNNLTFGGAVALPFTSSTTTNSETITLGGTKSTLTFSGAVTSGTIFANETLTVNGVGNTLVMGSFSLDAAPFTNTTIINGSGNVFINGAVTPGGVTSNALTYSGSGTLTLNGTSTYTGNTTISSGTLEFGNEKALYNDATGSWTTSKVKLSSGATYAFQVLGTATTGAGGDFTSADIDTLKGLAVSGSIIGLDTIDGNFTYANNLGSSVSGLGLIKLGANTLKLSGANTYTGTTTVTDGTLQVGVTNAIPTGSAVTINEITAGNTATLDIDGHNQQLASLTFGGATATGTSTTQVINSTGSNTLTLGGNVTYTATNNPFGSTISVNTLDLGAAARTFNIGLSTNATSDGLTISSLIQNGSLVKSGTGTLYLTGPNTFSGTTTFSGNTQGIINYQNGTALGNSAISEGTQTANTIQLQGGISGGTGSTMKISGVGATASGATGALESVSGTNTYAGLLSLGTAATIASDATSTLSLTNAGTITGAGLTLTLTGAGNGSIASIIGTTTGGLTMTGAGAWTLSGANTYTGITTISAGTLEFGNEKALYNDATGSWTTSKVKLSSGATYAFQVLGTATTGAGGDFTSADIDTLKGLAVSGSFIGLDTTDGNFSYANNLGSSVSGLGLTKLGANTLTLTGGNTYTGATTVLGGVLAVNGSGSLASGSTVTVGGSAAGNAPTLTGTGTVNGNVIVASAGGGVAGTINPGAVGTVGTLKVGSITFQSGSTFAVDLGAGAANTDLLTITNAATITSGADISFNLLTTPDQGNYVLATAGSGLNSASFTVLGSVPSGYTLVATATALDLQHNAVLTIAPAQANYNAHVGTSTAIGVTVGNSSPSGGASLTYNLTSAITGSNLGPVAPGATASPTGSYSVPSTAGVNNLSVTGTDTTNGTDTATAHLTVTGYNYASPTYTATLALGNVRVGASATKSVTDTTISNANYQDSLDVLATNGGNSLLTVGNPGNILAGNSGNITYTANAAGSLAATSSLGFTSDANGVSGLSNTALTAGSVAITGAAYNYASPTYTATLALGNIRVGASATRSVTDTTISNANYQDSLDVLATNGGNSLLTVGNPGNILAGNSGNITYTANAAGSLAATSSLGFTSDANGVSGLSNTALTAGSVAITGAAYNYASPTYTATLALGNVRVGASATRSVTDTTISNANYQDSLDVLATNGGNSLLTVGNPGNILAGNSGNITYTANAAGSLAATSSLGFTSDANGVSGLSNKALTAGSVAITGAAYNYASPTYTATLALGNVRVGASATRSVTDTTISNANYQDSLDVLATNGGNSLLTVGNPGNILAGNSGNITYTANAAGSLAATSSLGFTSDANGVSGLSNTALTAGSVAITGAAYNYASPTYTATLALGNVRVGASATRSVTDTTISNANYQDSLDVLATNGGNSLLTVGNPGNILAGNSGNITYTANAAGSLAATSSLGFTSDANGVSGLSNTALTAGSVAITGAAYNYASPTYTATLALGNVRVGASATRSVTDTTISNANYQDSLDVLATNGGNSLLTVGNPGNILAGNSGNITYTANAAGSLAATSSLGFTSDANGVSGLSNTALTAGSVAITGAAYNYASPKLNTVGPVALGNVRVGGTATGSVSITNTTITNASFQDSLDASATTNNGKVTGNGANITAGNSSSLTLTGNTATAGSLASTVTLGYVSNANGVSGLSNLTLASGSTTTTGGVYDYASPTYTATLTLGNVRVGASATKSVTDTTITNASYQDSLDVLATNGGNSLLTVGNPGNILAGNSGNITYTANAAGSLATTSSLGFTSDANGVSGLSNTALTAGSVAVTGAAYNYASPTLNTVGAIAFGNVHVGDTATGSVSISNTTITNASYQDSLDASVTTNNGNVTGTSANITAGNSSSLTLTGNTATAGSLASTVTLGYVSNANGVSGLNNLTLASGSITTTGQVYSGAGVWNADISGTSASYGTLSNMSNWTAAGGAPGLDSNFLATDSVSFGNNNTGAGTVFLNGSNPSLTSITFNNTNGGSYTLAQGSGGLYKLNNTNNAGVGASITDANGNDTISAPVQLDDNLNVSVTNGGNTLTLSGIISELDGSRKLTVSGAGTTVLSGTAANTYTGETTVSSGELDLNKTVNPGVGGIVAITGANAANIASPDILVSGGELKFLANDQLANSVDNHAINGDTMLLTSGIIDLHGTKQTLYAFQSTGGRVISTGGRGTLKATDPMYTGGTTDVGSGMIQGGPTIQISGTMTSVIVHGDEGSTLGGATLLLDGGGTGLEFTGGTLQLNSDTNATVGTSPNSYYAPGSLMFGSADNFNGPDGGTATVTVHAAASTATIGTDANFPTPNLNSGLVLLDGNNVTINTEGGAGSVSTASGGADLDISAVIADGTTTGLPGDTAVAGSITKTGAGNLQLSGVNTYTGTTTVAAGNLIVTGTSGSGLTTVGNNTATVATLSGTGTIGGAVTTATTGSNIAYLAPGVNSSDVQSGVSTGRANFGTAGTLSIAGALTIGTGTNLDFDLANATTIGSGVNDLISIGGGLTLGTNTVFNFNALTTLATGTAYTLINNATGITTGVDPFNAADFTTTGIGSYTATYADVLVGGTTYALEVTFNSISTAAYFNGTTSSDINDKTNFYTTSGGPTTIGSPVSSATDVYFTSDNTSTTGANVQTPTLNTGDLAVNSVTFTGTGTPAAGGVTLSGSNTLTIEAAAGAYAAGTGIVVQTGAGNNTISAPVALGGDQSWSVADSTTTLTVSNQVSGGHALTIAGAGTVKMANATGNSYSGGTTVGNGTDTPTLLISNTSNSATGTGALAVNAGATLAGKGLSSGSSFNVSGTGTTTSTVATVLVGHDSAADTNTASTMTLIGSGASTFANANLVFNLNTAVAGGLGTDPTGPGPEFAGSGNELLVGNTAITFGSGAEGANPVTLTLNLQNYNIIAAHTDYVLIAGTAVGTDAATSQYSGLSFDTANATGNITTGLITPILYSKNGDTMGNLTLSLSDGAADYYGNGSYLFLYQNSLTGVDDIEVEVVPEPSTWALMLGGLAMLIFIQRRRRQHQPHLNPSRLTDLSTRHHENK